MSKVQLTIETRAGEFVFSQHIEDGKPVLPAVFAATSAAVATRPGEVAELRRTLEAVAQLADLLGASSDEEEA